MAVNASQQLKVVGVLVIGLSGLLLFLAAVGVGGGSEENHRRPACLHSVVGSHYRDRIVAIAALGAALKSGLLHFSLHFRSFVSYLHSRSHFHLT